MGRLNPFGPRDLYAGGFVTRGPNRVGIKVYNATGSTIATDQLVAISGFDTTTQLPKVVLADANVAAYEDVWVTEEPIATATNGLVYKGRLSDDNLDTSGASAAGDPVYLSETAGAFTATAPTAATSRVHPVGFVVVKSASVGKILWNIGPVRKVGTNELQSAMALSLTTPTIAGATLSGTLAGTPTFDGAVVFSGAASFTGSPVGIPRIAGGVITELDGDATYNISVTIPAGALVLDVIVTAEALWTAATSATLIVGDTADPDGFLTAVNAKTTPAVGTSLRFDTVPAGTGDGAYLGDTNGEFVGPAVDNFGRYYKAGSVIKATITKVGSGTAGRTWFHVVYAMPQVISQVVT